MVTQLNAFFYTRDQLLGVRFRRRKSPYCRRPFLRASVYFSYAQAELCPRLASRSTYEPRR
jgi:hypothetical protein